MISWPLMNNASTSHLNKVAAWLNLTSTILHQVHYVLLAMMLTQAQCNQIMAPCYQARLLVAGYMWSFPHAILQAPYKYFGLGITNLYDEQGLQHLLALLQYSTNPDDTTGKPICIGLETLQLELGINSQQFAQDWNTFKYLVTPTWITHTWQFQAEHRIQIETMTPDIPLS